jgi:thiol-disulfide isomerase/thioredoxin
MTIKRKLLISFLMCAFGSSAQNFTGTYKLPQLLERMGAPDTIYVINFWATWCKPCVQELPAFDSLNYQSRSTKVKVLLVSLDFSEDIEKKVKPFLLKAGIETECVLLDEINGNDFVEKISPLWSGAIPATLIKSGKQEVFIEKKLSLSELKAHLKNFK